MNLKTSFFRSITPAMKASIHRLTALGIKVKAVEYDGSPIPITITQENCDAGLKGHGQKGMCTIASALTNARTEVPVYAGSIGPKISYLLLIDGRLLKVRNGKDAQRVVTQTDTPGLKPEPGTVHFGKLFTSDKRATYEKRNKTLKGKSRRSRGIQKHRPHGQRDISSRPFYSKCMNRALTQMLQNIKTGQPVQVG